MKGFAAPNNRQGKATIRAERDLGRMLSLLVCEFLLGLDEKITHWCCLPPIASRLLPLTPFHTELSSRANDGEQVVNELEGSRIQRSYALDEHEKRG